MGQSGDNQELVAARERIAALEDELRRLVAAWDRIRDDHVQGDSAGDWEGIADAVDRIAAERDAALASRNEFAAQEVERFADEFQTPNKSTWASTTIGLVASNRAAELRQAAPKPVSACGAEPCPPVTSGNIFAVADDCLARIKRLVDAGGAK